MEEPSVAVPFKKLIFFKYLSYWKTLDTPHAIDYMHLEKSVFESTIDVLLDIKGKTKDGLKSRTDLVNLASGMTFTHNHQCRTRMSTSRVRTTT
jgi:hypothetical protein